MRYTVFIDDALLARARQVLGRDDVGETIERGLREIVRRAEKAAQA
jgi:hypothetical protein